MAVQVVDRSTFTLETDLPPSSRIIHPSGILHVTRYSRCLDIGGNREDRHAFVWIANFLHVENAIRYIKTRGGFGAGRRCAFAFIPYSTKENWAKRYPHAAPAYETTYESGETKILLGPRWEDGDRDVNDEGLGEQAFGEGDELNDSPGEGSAIAVATASKSAADGSNNIEKNDDSIVILTGGTMTKLSGGEVTETTNVAAKKEKKKRVHKSKAVNILKDNTYLPDAERDELHAEIYNYFKWLHDKLFEIEQKMKEDAIAKATVKGGKGSGDEYDDDSDEYDENNIHKTTGKRRYTVAEKTSVDGVKVSELNGVVTKLESTFAIIPNMKLEETAEWGLTGTKNASETRKNAESQRTEGDKATDNDANGGPKGAPFLEEALASALRSLVTARESSGKPRRRSRKRPRPRKGDGLTGTGCKGGKRLKAEDFDILLERLKTYKEEFGDCAVSRTYEDSELANWVRGIREKKFNFDRRGIEYETLHKGRAMTAKTLTRERLERLEAVGFSWTVEPAVPPPTWDDRFQELMDYYHANDNTWPSQSMGQLGEWVHRQRSKYSEKNVNYMRKYAQRLDEVGFEWTPRGYTKMSWDEGFELLMEFGRINGHLDVPCPDYTKVDKKSREHRFYKWVESLHGMYRSYKVGRNSGSLTDERVVLLVKHGFQFRNY